jgi:hypothetical protein
MPEKSRVGAPRRQREEDEMQDLQQIEHDIEVTRNRLDDDLDALAARVSPAKAIRRAKFTVRERVTSLPDRIPGGDVTVLASVLVLGVLLFVLPRRSRG